MQVRTADYTADLVPLDERMRYMRWFRVGAVIAVFASWLALPDFRQVPLLELGISLGGYLAITLGAEAVWKLSKRRSLSGSAVSAPDSSRILVSRSSFPMRTSRSRSRSDSARGEDTLLLELWVDQRRGC